jgi:hypothetical protein
MDRFMVRLSISLWLRIRIGSKPFNRKGAQRHTKENTISEKDFHRFPSCALVFLCG